MTEWDKLKNGKLYDAGDPYIDSMRIRCRHILYEYNRTRLDEVERRKALLNELFGKKVNLLVLEPYFHCDYGVNIEIGDLCIVNSGCTFLDCGPIKIGSKCLFGPGVVLTPVTHLIDPELRATGYEYSDPIVIGDNVWIGAGTVVNPGVTIGDNSVIGAGSVVTKDIPGGVVAFGVPCRVVRDISERDREAMEARFAEHDPARFLYYNKKEPSGARGEHL